MAKMKQAKMPVGGASIWTAALATGLVFGSVTIQAATWYWNGNVSQDWANPGNFQRSGDNIPGVPEPYDDVYLEDWAIREPLLTTNTYAPLFQVFTTKTMTVAAGGQLDVGYSIKIGWNGSATLNVAGIVSADNHLDVGGYNGGTATLNVTGGSMSVGGFYLNLAGTNTGASYVNLTGGTITQYGPLSINTTHPAVLNLAGGTLILPDSNLGNVNYWITTSHSIVAYNGAGTVNIDTTSIPGQIVLTGVVTPNWIWNGNISQDWSNGDNFESNISTNSAGVPVAGSSVFVEAWATVQEPLINNGGHASLSALSLSTNMTVASGGSLVATNLNVGQNAEATLAVTGGTLNASFLKVGRNASSTVEVNGGSVSADNHLDVGGYHGATARFNVSDGTVTVGGLYLNLESDATSTNAAATNSVGGSQVNLSGGTIMNSGALSINSLHPALLNISGGTLVVPTSQQNNVNFWINSGDIAGYGVGVTSNEFDFDLTSMPGSVVITARNSAITAASFQDYDPQVLGALPPPLDQTMSNGVPAGLCVLADSGFSFGTAVGTNGEVYVTDFPGQKINRYNPEDGSMTVVVSNRPAVYGVAADNFGNLFYAQDSDNANGTVIKRTPGGTETTIISGLTRPRQLTTDSAGNLYVALEAAREVLKWQAAGGTVSTFVDASRTPGTPQGVAMAPDGRLYMSGYGRGAGQGTLLLQGAVWVRETNGMVNLVAGGFARARGLALHPHGDLYLNAEANPWDNGNSGVFVRIDTNGTVTTVLEGVDYPQFPSIGSDGLVYTTIARDQKLVCFDPANNYALQSISTPSVSLAAEGAAWQETPGANVPFQLKLTNTNNPADNLTIAGYLDLDSGASEVGMWFNIPVTNLNISLAQIPNSAGNTNSGIYELPAASVTWSYGLTTVEVLALREHQRCRWPMSNVGNPTLEAPAPDFGETPESYLAYVRLAIPPSLTIKAWTANQVRISWPVSATGYTLQRSTTVNGGYANAGLSVTVEGSENAAYDTRGSGARFYRLVQ